MARIPEYPPILNGSTELQIAQIREFLMRLVRDLADAGIYDESTGAAEIEAVDQKIDDLADSLADVATSGSYNDLTNKPTIPTGNEITTEEYTASVQALSPGGTVLLQFGSIQKSGYTPIGLASIIPYQNGSYSVFSGLVPSGWLIDNLHCIVGLTNTSSSGTQATTCKIVVIYKKNG